MKIFILLIFLTNGLFASNNYKEISKDIIKMSKQLKKLEKMDSYLHLLEKMYIRILIGKFIQIESLNFKDKEIISLVGKIFETSNKANYYIILYKMTNKKKYKKIAYNLIDLYSKYHKKFSKIENIDKKFHEIDWQKILQKTLKSIIEHQKELKLSKKIYNKIKKMYKISKLENKKIKDYIEKYISDGLIISIY